MSEKVLQMIASIERDIQALRQLVIQDGKEADANGNLVSIPPGFFGRPANSNTATDEGIEGEFDGERMLDANGKTYPVPPNYASKSKLIEGDPLKLYITQDGKYVYKQMGPIERRNINGTLKQDDSRFYVEGDDGNQYQILTACVTYYMALFNIKPGDRVSITVPADRQARFAVIDSVAE